jgi:hypothetical protein
MNELLTRLIAEVKWPQPRQVLRLPLPAQVGRCAAHSRLAVPDRLEGWQRDPFHVLQTFIDARRKRGRRDEKMAAQRELAITSAMVETEKASRRSLRRRQARSTVTP